MSVRMREARDCERCGESFHPWNSSQRFCSLACVPRKGVELKGGISFTSSGRKLKVLPDGKTRLYSRWLMEEELGRELDRDEVVHHINGDPTDDRIENLEVLTRTEHMEHHRDELIAGQRAA